MHTAQSFPSEDCSTTPDVSIIMPAYNTEAYIKQAIESALNQTLANVEVIVVDDASTDRTADVVAQIDDPRLKVVRLPQNGGAAVARNRALDEARGNWVAVLDSDDWYAPDRLEALLQVAIAHDADMVADDMYYIEDGESAPWTTLIRRSGEHVIDTISIDPAYYVRSDVPEHQGLHLGFSKPLIKRDFIEAHAIRYKNEIRMGQDFFIYLNCLAHGARFVLHPKAYYYYRARPGSLVEKSRSAKGQLERLSQGCRGLSQAIESETIQTQPELLQALQYKLRVCQRLRAYYRVVEPLKRKALLTALVEMSRNPYFFVRFITQLPNVVNKRINPDRAGQKAASNGTVYQVQDS